MEAKYIFAQQIVREAGEFLRQHRQDELHIEEKGHFTDLVTHLDRQVQEDLTRKIHSRYPEDKVYGEETGEAFSLETGAVWLIDPIDGTTNFVAQRTDFAVLLAYFEEGEGQFGLIYDVMQDKLYHGGGRFPVYENDLPLLSYQSRRLKESLIGLNAGLYSQNVGGLADLADQTLGTRSIGSAGLAFSHVLTGRLLLVASYLYPWDYAAAAILGVGLGYQMLRLDGQSPSLAGREYVLFLPKEQIAEVMRYLVC